MDIDRFRERVAGGYEWASNMARTTDDSELKAFHSGRAEAYLLVLQDIDKLERN